MFGKKAWVWIALALAVALSVFAHSAVWSQWYYPTFGNTNIHVAFAEYVLEHGGYPIYDDFSYGGGIPALYVPGYRLLLAATAFLAGSMGVAQNVLVTLLGLLLPIGVFLLARELFGDPAGVAAAFFASLPSELLIYTIRPLPQGLGIALLPFAFYAIAANKKKTALALTFAIALTHQEAVLFLAIAAFAYAAAMVLLKWVEKKKVSFTLPPAGSARIALLCWALALVTYVGWNFLVMGNLNVFGIAQFQNHEGMRVDFSQFAEKTGWVVSALGILGFVILLAKNVFERSEKEIFLLALAIIGFALVKNELLGIRVFMDRFLVYLQIPLVILAAFALKVAVDYALQLDLKTFLPKPSS